MDLAPSISTPPNTTPKSPEQESETPTRIQPAKPISFTNGVLKRHHLHHRPHSPPVVVTYKECLKNHAASLGGHAVDGCCEFMPSPAATPSDPTSLKCAACGCHRNFHRREPDDPPPTANVACGCHRNFHIREPDDPHPTANTIATIEYQPHHRHHPPHPPPAPNRSPNSASPPPISSSYYPSAPHMLLALSSGLSALPDNVNVNTHLQAGAKFSGGALTNPSSNSKKRFRTKFSPMQKEKMLQFADKVGWKLQKRDEDLIQDFCKEIEVERGVLKVWMHNNKNTFGRKEFVGNGGRHGSDGNLNGGENDSHGNNNGGLQNLNHHFDSDAITLAGTNGSSSS